MMKKELTLRELQLFCLEILKDVHAFCVDNDIKYSLQDGSLIGVIRHSGFIPWDDDIDIIMPRPDFLRFCQTYHSDKYELVCPENDNDCFVAFARVYDRKKTVADGSLPWCNRQYGVSIDIFPADGAFENINRHNRYYTISRLLWKASCYCRAPLSNDFDKTKSLLHFCLYLFSKFFNARFFSRRVFMRAAKIPYGKTPYWTQMTCMGDNSKERHSLRTFDHCILMPFEDTTVMVMNGYDEVLRDKYNDYMKLPPVEDRKKHSTMDRFYWRENRSSV